MTDRESREIRFNPIGPAAGALIPHTHSQIICMPVVPEHVEAEARNSAEHFRYHWHLEICPRTSIPTGFELGSGLFVNTISPEIAARKLRDVVLED